MEEVGTPTAVTSLDDTTVQEEQLNARTPLVDEKASASAAAATPTTITYRNDDDTTQQYKQQEPLESQTPLVVNRSFQTPLVDEGKVGVVVKLNEDDKGVSAAATPTIIASINDDDTTQEYDQEAPLEVGAAFNLKEDDADVHATMAKRLPKIAIIQSNNNNKYLHLYNENPSLPNALRFDGDYSFELETRFDVVPATKGTGLIHIRCLYNNKYWANFSGNWVTASAVEPEENQSDPRCTLFRPIFSHRDNNSVLKLRHVRTGYYVSTFIGGGVNNRCLTLWPTDNYNVCTFIDWESVVVLPNLIRIKGDNGNHLRAWADGFMDYQVKADNSSLFDYEVSPSRNGGIRLKSVRFGTYWTDMNNSHSIIPQFNSAWVLLRESSSTAHATNTVFLPTLVGGNRIVMRVLRNNLFCNRHTGAGKRECLAALNTHPDGWSYMEIEEPVISRRISNVRYHLTDARIYNQRTFALVTDEVRNRTEATQTSQINIKTTVSNSTKWSNGLTHKAGITISMQRGVPLVSSIGFQISAEVTKSLEWGGSETETLEVGNVRILDVLPKREKKGYLMATRLQYDIPFSYRQVDILSDGTTKEYVKDDGIFTGVDGYDYDDRVDPL